VAPESTKKRPRAAKKTGTRSRRAAKKPAQNNGAEPPPIPATMTKAQFAALCGISVRVVADLAGRGTLVYAGRSLRMPDSLHRYLDSLRKSAMGRQGSDGSDLVNEKAKLTRIQSETAEIQLRKARGELLDLPEVAEGWSRITGVVRSAVLGIPSQARAKLPHLTPHDGQVIDRVCRDALEIAADELVGAPIPGSSGPADLSAATKTGI
jgi:phage terminase Nu1 subunit (DNA packaging protein)